jgi:hypothetical protein
VGHVRFWEPALPGTSDADVLRRSAADTDFVFDVTRFPRATAVHDADREVDAARHALFEIDRTLDTLAFTDLGRSRYLPVGYAIADPPGAAARPLAFRETYPAVPLPPSITPRVMNEFNLRVLEGFMRHTRHLLSAAPTGHSSASRALATALRWCRLGSLARGFSESVTVAFVMEWMALETLLLIHPRERIKDALPRVVNLMKNWPPGVASDYTPGLRSENPEKARAQWEQIVQELYRERKEIFHGREFHVYVDPTAKPSWEHGATMFGCLEAILGRCVAFVGRRSQVHDTLADIWGGSEEFVPDRDDTPPTNLGGWGRSWGLARG